MRRTSWSNVMSRSGWLDWANFCPTGDCFLWTVYKKLKKYAAHIFGLLFHNCFDKNVLGSILGDFFTNSSGHTAHDHFFFLSLFCLSVSVFFCLFLPASVCLSFCMFQSLSLSISVYVFLCVSLLHLCVYMSRLLPAIEYIWNCACKNFGVRPIDI
jgi:hypothetical protein